MLITNFAVIAVKVIHSEFTVDTTNFLIVRSHITLVKRAGLQPVAMTAGALEAACYLVFFQSW